MQTSAWISLALATLLPSSAIAFDASSPPQRGGGSTTLDNLTLMRPGSSGPIGGMCATAPGGSVCRTLSDRAADRLNVKDKGAKLDGSDDTSAFLAARSAASADATIDVPAGQFVLKSTPTAGPATSVLWRLSGNKFGSSTTPVTGIGTDTIESVVEGGKYFGRSSSRPLAPPVVRMDSTLNMPTPNPETGTAQGVMSTLKVNMDIPRHATELGYFGWAQSTTLRSSAWGSGQHVAVAAQVIRPPDALADGKGPRAVVWANYGEVTDETRQSVKDSGSLVIGEFDMYANGEDYVSGQAQRIGHHMVFSRRFADGARMRANYGHFLSTNDIFAIPAIPKSDYSYLGVGYGMDIGFDIAAFDASLATSMRGAPAFKMASGQRLAFDGSDAGYNRSLYFDSGLLTYRTQNGPAFQAADNGDFITFGVLKAQAFSVPDQSAPTSTSDPLGAVGDVRFNGQFMYRKTSSGWLRFAGSKF